MDPDDPDVKELLERKAKALEQRLETTEARLAAVEASLQSKRI